jgi:hypothetical protein
VTRAAETPPAEPRESADPERIPAMKPRAEPVVSEEPRLGRAPFWAARDGFPALLWW